MKIGEWEISETYRQVKHPVLTFGVFFLILEWGCCCCFDNTFEGGEFSKAVETVERRGAGSAAMTSMRDGVCEFENENPLESSCREWNN